MAALDYFLIAFYLAALTASGIYFGRKQKNAQDLFLASKSMAWFPVGISIVAAFISGISYIGLPSEVRTYGLAFILFPLSYWLVVPIVLRFILPFYASQQVSTAYEYLEKRFSLSVRRLASGIFIVWRLLWIATVIYVPSLVFSGLTGTPLVPTILIVGLVTTTYTTLGGIEAVIWTDLAQFVIMFVGALATIVFILWNVPGGVVGIWNVAENTGHTKLLNFSLDPTVRVTVWGALIGGFFANLAYFGVDQLIIQRYLTTPSLQAARKSYLVNCIALTSLVLLLAVVGLAVFAFYEIQPQLLPSAVAPDNVFPFFIAHQLPPGLVGLLFGAIAAASVSSLGGGINAVSTAFYSDFLRLDAQKVESLPGKSLFHGRALMLIVGGIATILACFVGKLGTVMEIAVRLVDGFPGPLLAIFLLAIFTRRVTASPIIVAVICGILVTAYVNFFSPLSFLWYSVAGCLSTLIAAFIFAGIRALVRPQPEYTTLHD